MCVVEHLDYMYVHDINSFSLNIGLGDNDDLDLSVTMRFNNIFDTENAYKEAIYFLIDCMYAKVDNVYDFFNRYIREFTSRNFHLRINFSI